MPTQNTSQTPKRPYTPQFQLPEEFPLKEPIRRFKQLPDAEKERILRDFRCTKEWKRHCWGETFGAAQRYLCEMFGIPLCRKFSIDYRYTEDGRMFVKAHINVTNDRYIKMLATFAFCNTTTILKYISSCKSVEISATAKTNDVCVNVSVECDEPKENSVEQERDWVLRLFEKSLKFCCETVFETCVKIMTFKWENAHREENYLDFIYGKIWHLDDNGKVILDFCER